MEGAIAAMREKRAIFSRDVEYVREMASDDEILPLLEKVESHFNVCTDTISNYKEVENILSEMPTDFTAEENAEIRRILESTEDMTFQDMIGIVIG